MAGLRAAVDEPEAIAWVDEILDRSERLDAMSRRARGGGAQGVETDTERELRHRLVFSIEQNVDRVFTHLKAEPVAFRRELVALETSTVRWAAGLIAAAPLLVLAVALYLSRSVAEPLARLSEGAAAVRDGRLDTRIRIDSHDEFGALAAEFNAMTAALAQHQERLVESEKLASIGRMAAGVAHELNNPLQVMLGYITLDRNAEDPQLREHLAEVERETLRCKAIVEDLLELSRPMLVCVPVDLRQVCDDVVRGLRIALNGHAGRLSVDGAASALGDPTKLRQVIFNLVKNAAEAAGPQGNVVVALRARDDRAEVEVADDGPGVPPETRGRIFEPFFTTKHCGKGLGLAVSRAFARAHGGEILVESRNSRGAVFTLEVPRAPERRA
jgi:signal transduction histidine kinase